MLLSLGWDSVWEIACRGGNRAAFRNLTKRQRTRETAIYYSLSLSFSRARAHTRFLLLSRFLFVFAPPFSVLSLSVLHASVSLSLSLCLPLSIISPVRSFSQRRTNPKSLSEEEINPRPRRGRRVCVLHARVCERKERKRRGGEGEKDTLAPSVYYGSYT